MSQEPKPFYAVTVGTFIKMLVDGGDHAVIFRILAEQPEDDQKRYTQLLEVTTIPNGQVQQTLQAFLNQGADLHMEDDLTKFLEGGHLK